ncbi:DUF3429 domain-containing protein [Aliiglaciecola sp. LCG003]|uniref:DUF3429 domain-containing protein n=1 Tax=Aliiglaciecola sp. LCG003 TaxID=3053655 RepID=UPI0025739D58|nr:DUF3429 domain-containing protein [Aliiglaciecola sp. LCG003]WJG10961.1 DUF3429 domain-containing protein [Aliiglaciecola sp. LCG003]
MNKAIHCQILGYAGLIPFILLPFLTVWGTVSFFEGVSFFNQYSVIILSFLGGVLWQDAIRFDKSSSQLYIAMLPSLIGWFALALLPAMNVLWVLLCCYLLVLIYEFSVMDQQVWYRSLRIRLTAISMGGHLMMIWLLYTGF